MTVFISHSFDNKPEFDNVTDSLDLASVSFWNPTEIQSGAPLRDQLLDALSSCDVCIFVATHASVHSSWCGAELGAFWGAGMPIIVYLADSSLTEDALPPIVQGDVWERRISRVALRAKELSSTTAERPVRRDVPKSGRVSNMTVQQLQDLITGTISLVDAAEKTTGAQVDGSKEKTRSAADRLLKGIDVTNQLSSDSESWQRQVLWVDDRPENNVHERQALESLGLNFTLSLSTDEALEQLKNRQFAAIISDMGRKEGPREGYVLLDKIRADGNTTPFIIYAGSRSQEHRREAAERGAQGVTNMAGELVDLVVTCLKVTANLNLN